MDGVFMVWCLVSGPLGAASVDLGMADTCTCTCTCRPCVLQSKVDGVKVGQREREGTGRD